MAFGLTKISSDSPNSFSIKLAKKGRNDES